MSCLRRVVLSILGTLAVASTVGAADPPPRYVEVGADGKLVYRPDEKGHRVPDFSSSGYRGGGVAIPDAPVRLVVEPSAGDNTGAIQTAIDRVSAMPRDGRGLRGAIVLKAGRHDVWGRLRVEASGVVIRGQGDGPGGTVVVARGTDRRTPIKLSGRAGLRAEEGSAIAIVDDFVPIGSRTLRLGRLDNFQAGDAVVIEHPSTAAWIASLGMDRFAPGDAGGWLKWLPGSLDVRFERTIAAIEGTTITLDAPLTTSFDRESGGGRVMRSRPVGRISEVGLENLRLESDYEPGNPSDEAHAWDAIALEAVEDGWVRQVTFAHFAGSAVRVGDESRRVTVEDCSSLEPISEVGGYRRHTYFTSGQQALFQRCKAELGRHDFAVGALAQGPNAFVDCMTSGSLDFSGPIESWASGVLLDNITMMDGGALSLTNRESAGQGVGWAGDGSVLWQCAAPVVTCRRPPGGQNWAIGCWGMFLGDGLWQMPNEFVKPESLYRAQLAERLGPKAVANLARRLIPTEVGDAPVLELIPSPETKPLTRPIAVRDGRIERDGRLLIGSRTGTPWWRGHILPARTIGAGGAVTRFVPGREGAGYTDDLDELTDALVAGGKAALEHHWGLWYDRRRDDHEMVRRPDGDVWPPFYEQPWSRSGKGIAWDGLSRYDLESFNPWYFGRLDRFAELCDRKGLVLLHHGYFQHNILEAGAHWADFPWRPANCLQATGFPEPPPYAGKKRIFMADAFYDTTHPERRRLHRLYIRHCLDILGSHPNVVFLIGDEFTGPLEFMRFWLDTVTEWERETGRDVLIGLGATKDVQDAILDDPVRGPAVSVIEMKYWWYTADGILYAPEGGKNLAPRQQLREWTGKNRRSDDQTARQVREYRQRHPGKAVLVADGGANPWFVLASGGSMPALPAGTNARLLSALPRMRPAPREGRAWTLADPGRDYLAVASPGESVLVDLSTVESPFAIHQIDASTGRLTGSPGTVNGGRVVSIPASSSGPTVLWLTREKDPRP